MSAHEPLFLSSGTPVIMLELTVEADDMFLHPTAPRVHAGRLVEPHPLEQGVSPSLMTQGPFARSVPSGAFEGRAVLWSDDGETMMLFLSEAEIADRGGFPHEGLRLLFVLEDTKGVVDRLEAEPPSDWDTHQQVRDDLYRRVLDGFSVLFTDMWHPPYMY